MDKKTYNCEFCERVFNNSSNCKKHQLICKKKPTTTTTTTNNEIELLKHQLELQKQQQEIEILKLQLQLQQQQIIQEQPKPEKKPFDIKQYLSNECKDAISFDDLLKKVLDSYDENYYFQNKHVSLDKQIAPLFNKEMLKLKQTESPFQITDENRLNGYLKYKPQIIENGVWVDIPEKPLGFYKINKISLKEIIIQKLKYTITDKAVNNFLNVKDKCREDDVILMANNINWYSQDPSRDGQPNEFEHVLLNVLIKKILSYIEIIDC